MIAEGVNPEIIHLHKSPKQSKLVDDTQSESWSHWAQRKTGEGVGGLLGLASANVGMRAVVSAACITIGTPVTLSYVIAEAVGAVAAVKAAPYVSNLGGSLLPRLLDANWDLTKWTWSKLYGGVYNFGSSLVNSYKERSAQIKLQKKEDEILNAVSNLFAE